MKQILGIFCTPKYITVSLMSTGSKKTVVKPDAALAVCEALLHKEHASTSDLSGIIVVMDDVSFTKARQTIAMTNALCTTLKIPSVIIKNEINQPYECMLATGLKKLRTIKLGTVLKPIYYAPPTITKPRRVS